ncbi:alpha/beta fold hydrolase [Nonomuraea sp. NPDC049709]|uniref:alpha/beta fold hydrolase n=1 Tax=Nonomuraea sp. NPDC049709 TaxID=3154736 RepID=UPI00343B3AE8
MKLHYREAGVPSPTACLLLHGFPSSSYSFRDVLPTLGKHMYAIAPDIPGFGFSDAPPLDEYEYNTFFDIAEVVAYHQDTTTLEAHVYDAGHLMLETHATEVAALLVTFIGDVLDQAGIHS